MISFNVCHEGFLYPVSVDGNSTVVELRATIIGLVGIEFEDISLFLEDVGNLDDENMADLSLDCLGLVMENTYRIFVYNIKEPSGMWRNLCTRNLTGFDLITQVGCYVENSYPVCHACRVFCKPTKEVSYEILDTGYFCMCSSNGKCCFSESATYREYKDLVFKNIHSILNHHAGVLVKKEQDRIDKLKQEILNRHFDFEKS
jgi:hypothetical protein